MSIFTAVKSLRHLKHIYFLHQLSLSIIMSFSTFSRRKINLSI